MERTISNIIHGVVWENYNGENRCKGCGVWQYTGLAHRDDCFYGEILKRVNAFEPDGLVAELVKALELYGKHTQLCAIIGGYEHYDCTRGLTDTLTKYKASGAATQGQNGQDAQPLLGKQE